MNTQGISLRERRFPSWRAPEVFRQDAPTGFAGYAQVTKERRITAVLARGEGGRVPKRRCAAIVTAVWFMICTWSTARGQQAPADWESQVRRYVELQDWTSALRVVDEQVARAPEDMDTRAWRARILTWSGKLSEAEDEYQRILKVSREDPDVWLGLSGLYLREGRIEEALRASDRAVELDPKRADLHEARARALRALGDRSGARAEFRKALDLNPASSEASQGLLTVRGEPKHQLRFGEETDLFSFAEPNNDQFVSLASQWTSHWATTVAEDIYQRAGVDAEKFVAGITGRLPHWGALTIGGAIGHDKGVIPKEEAFFECDHGITTSESGFMRGLEFVYGQHWYWYQGAHILTTTGTGVVYMPREWMWSLSLTGARSAFIGTGVDWRPSGVSRLGFPLVHKGEKGLSGSVFFAVGTESFGEVDQIGRFSSQTYGGGLRYQFSSRQDVTGSASFQQRTQNRADTNFGFSYGIHF